MHLNTPTLFWSQQPFKVREEMVKAPKFERAKVKEEDFISFCVEAFKETESLTDTFLVLTEDITISIIMQIPRIP